jgi:hypothetical protein
MNILNKTSEYTAVIAVSFVMAIGVLTSPFATHAQVSDFGCCDAGYTDYGYSDAGYTDYGYSNPGYTDYGYSNPGYTDYGYSDAGYTDYGYSNPGYTDYGYSNPGYTDYGLGGYGGYGGNTASPIYSYGTPSYGGIGGYGGYGGYSTGGGYYVEPIPTWPTMPRYTATPSYSNTYVDNTRTPTWPTTTHVTATATGGSANQQQEQTQANSQTNSQILSSTQTQNNPVTVTTGSVTQNQAPINNSNTNITNINIPAPVYQAPNQFSVNYNFAQEYQVPTCTISVSNSYYNSYSNNPVTLTWSSTKAFSASISPSVGTVNPNGSTTVYPTGGTTIYTLTVHGQGGSNTCQTQVIYQQQPTYQPPVYVPPQVTPPPYVALTQIPYTGFDFGPVGNSIYWAGLLSFALAAAYLVIYYKGGLAFATGTIGTRRSTPRAEKTAKTIVSAEAPVAKTPTSMFADLPTREYRNSTADTMNIKLAQNADEMPRITITRA